jgi:hypothetical protein
MSGDLPVVVAKSDTNIKSAIQDLFSSLNVPGGDASLDKVYTCMRVMIAEKRFKKAEFMNLLSTLFLIYEKVPTLTYEQKKASIKNVISRLLAEIPMNSDDRAIVNISLSLASPIVDHLYDFLYAKASVLLDDAKKSKCWASCASTEKSE